MAKIKKVIFGLLVMMFAVVALSSCNKEKNQDEVQLQKSSEIDSPLQQLVIKEDKNNVKYLSFKDSQSVRQYEDFVLSAVENGKLQEILEYYNKKGFSPLYYSLDSLRKNNVYHDKLSSLLLNKKGTIEVRDKVFLDTGNNFISMKISPFSKPADDLNPKSVSGVGEGCYLKYIGEPTFLLTSELAYIKPFWSDPRVMLTSRAEISGKGLASINSIIKHYYVFDLIVDGVIKRGERKDISDGYDWWFESLIAKGENITFGYCYATTTSASRTGACNDQVQVRLKLE